MAKSRFSQLLAEAIEGLPDSYNPYDKTSDDGQGDQKGDGLGDTDSGVDLGSAVEGGGEPAGIESDGSGGSEEEGGGELAGINSNDVAQKMEEPEKGEQVAPPPAMPTVPSWTSFPLPNKKDIGLRRSDGFILRMRKLESLSNKWLAQVFIGDKVLDKGQVIVPQDVDPITYIRDMADYMLDALSERDVQVNDTSEESAEAVVPGLEQETPGAGEQTDLSELGLFDDNFEMQD